MTQRELYNAIRGYGEKQNLLYRSGWEQARWIGAVILNSSMGAKKKTHPRDLMKLPWDETEADRSAEIELIKERRKWLTQ